MNNSCIAQSRLSYWARRKHFVQLMRLDKPIGLLLLGWPMLWGLWIAAEGWPSWRLFLIFCLGTIFTRTAGCCINDYADRDFDGKVKRTHARPLTNGSIAPREALVLTGLLMLMAFGLVLLTNALTIQLSFVAVTLAIVYPFCKRWTHWPQAVLGAAFGMGIPMAFAAVTNAVPMVAWFLFLVSIVWSVAYDTMYAMVDRDDDLELGLKSTAILFGRHDVVIVMIFQTCVLGGLLGVGLVLGLSTLFYVGLFAAALTVVYQYFLIKDRDRDSCFKAFLNNNYTGMAVFFGLVAHYAVAV